MFSYQFYRDNSVGLLTEKFGRAYGVDVPGVTGVHALVRRAHEERVLSILRERGGLSRAQIAVRAGLSRTTLSEITGDLLARGAIVVVTTDAGLRAGSGRPAELLALDPCSGQFLGVDLQHSRVRVAVADAAHEIMASGFAGYPPDTDLGGRLTTAFTLIDRIGRDSGVSFDALQGVGVGVAGPHPADCRVRDAFAARFSAPVIVDNNTRFAALAEASMGSAAASMSSAKARTDGAEARDVLYIRLSDGIGGGLVVGGRLVAGGRGRAGEFGHIAVDPAGDLCRCGKRGCLETVASVPAVLRAAGLRSLDDLTGAESVIDRAADAVGRVLAEAALLLNPEQIIIGGSLTRAAPRIVARAGAVVAAELVSVGGGQPLIRAARLGDDDGARGAIVALFRQSPLLADYPSVVGT
jgi:predicted NBD/HSP70 family sugar kinase